MASGSYFIAMTGSRCNQASGIFIYQMEILPAYKEIHRMTAMVSFWDSFMNRITANGKDELS
jgi:hypothetical protein